MEMTTVMDANRLVSWAQPSVNTLCTHPRFWAQCGGWWMNFIVYHSSLMILPCPLTTPENYWTYFELETWRNRHSWLIWSLQSRNECRLQIAKQSRQRRRPRQTLTTVSPLKSIHGQPNRSRNNNASKDRNRYGKRYYISRNTNVSSRNKYFPNISFDAFMYLVHC